jgi:hypothetical protein
MSTTEHELKPEAYWVVNDFFSVSGAILRARRSRLTAQTLESLLIHMEKDKWA